MLGGLNLGEVVADFKANTVDFVSGVKKAKSEVDGLQKTTSEKMKAVGSSLQGFGRSFSLYVTAPLTLAGGAAIKMSGDFEASMNKVRAISGATGDDFERLREQAKELGIRTQFSASQAADAMSFLAMAGFEANEIIGSMPATLDLAAAAQLDLASSADIVSNIMTGYGVTVEELPRAVDVLTKSFTSANTDLSQLGEAFKYAGPVAKSAGIQFEEASAALSLMGNAGIQATMAGTALRGAITRLLNPTDEMQGIMNKLGLEAVDSSGNLKPLHEILKQLETSGINTADAMELFGLRAGPAMLGLLEQGSDALVDLTAKLEDSGGVAKTIAEIQMEGFNGAMKELRSAIEGLAIAIGESGVLEWLTGMARKLTDFIRGLAASNPAILKWGAALLAIVAIIGPLTIFIGMFISALATIGLGGAAIIAGLVGIGAAVVYLISQWDEFVASLKIVGAAIATLWSGMIAGVEEFMKGVADKFRSGWEAVKEIWNGAINNIIDIFTHLPEILGFMLGQWVQTWINRWNALVQFTTQTLPNFFMVTIPGWFGAMKDRAGQKMTETKDETINTAGNLVTGVVAWFSELPGRVLAWVKEIWPRTKAAWDDIKNKIFDWAKNTTQSVVDWFADLPSRIADAIKGAAGKVSDFVGDIARRFGEGFSAGRESLQEFATGGQFMVGGKGGIDNNLVAFKATRGEMVTVSPAGGGSGPGGTVNVYVEQASDMQDWEAVGREVGFRAGINPRYKQKL